MGPYLNRRDDHVDPDFALPDLLERRHDVADVVQVFDWSVETLGEVVDEVEDGLHLGAVFEVTSLAVLQAPRLRLRRQTQLQPLCGSDNSRTSF